MDIVTIMTVCAVAHSDDFMYNEKEIAKYNTVWPKYSCTETAKVVRKNVSFLDFDMMTRGEGAISYKHTVPAKALKKLFTDPSFLVHMRNVHNWEDAPDLARYLKTLEEENERTNKALKEIEEGRAKGKRKPTSSLGGEKFESRKDG
ncbi:MAG: hypothetical protein LBG69_08840 [Zoogloeaceae bacterium]|jgi:hypothetical protein|nr:hypothetical protein [Zoogloeaceae bacterium]